MRSRTILRSFRRVLGPIAAIAIPALPIPTPPPLFRLEEPIGGSHPIDERALPAPQSLTAPAKRAVPRPHRAEETELIRPRHPCAVPQAARAGSRAHALMRPGGQLQRVNVRRGGAAAQ